LAALAVVDLVPLTTVRENYLEIAVEASAAGACKNLNPSALMSILI